MKKIAKALIMILLAGLIIPAWGEEADQPSPWAKESIEKLKAWGRINAACFEKYQVPLARKELAALSVTLFEALSGEAAAGVSDELKHTFKDTEDNDVLQAWQLGIFSGDDNGCFRPEAPVTREEMAKIIIALAEKASKPLEMGTIPLQSYQDSTAISPWAENSLRICLSQGIMMGYENHCLEPQGKVTREQGFKMMATLMELKSTLKP